MARLCGFGIRGFKRSAAAATARRVRILDAEPGTGQVVGIINRCSSKEARALGIDDHFNPIPFKNLIAFLRMIQRHPILQPCATAFLNEDAQAFCGVILFSDERLQVLGG